MAERPTYSFGEPNWDTVGRWLHLDPADDGPVWMLNLMKYRQVAAYSDRGDTTVSGKEADDAYAPLGPLAAVGAMVAFFGNVAAQPAGEPVWDRVAMVRYPTRMSFFQMQERDDFKKQYVHKEAGMEFTIIMGCVPDGTPPAATPTHEAGDRIVMRVRRFAEGERPDEDPAGVVPVLHFEVDGVVLGDERVWDDVRVDRVADDGLSRLLTTGGVAEQIVTVVDPTIDRLVDSVAGAARTG
jgi:hypothetical protein